MKELNTNNFNDVIASEKPVLVDFWAPWCMPCRMIAPILEDVAASREDIDFAKVNIDENQELAQKYSIMSIPTMAVFKKGEVIGQIVGGRDEDGINQFIDQTIKG